MTKPGTNRLKRADQFKVADVLRGVETQNTSYASLIKKVRDDTGIECTKDTIHGLLKDMGKPTPRLLRASPKSNTDRLVLVSRYLMELYEKVGEQVPEGLRQLVDEKACSEADESESKEETLTHVSNGKSPPT